MTIFYFFFTYNEISYEVELLRKVTDHGIIFVPYGYQINKKEIGIGGIHLHILILTIATVISGASRKFFSTIDDKLFNLAFTACSRGINNPVRSERV